MMNKYSLCLGVLWALFAFNLQGQERADSSKAKVEFSGLFQITHDYYSLQGNNIEHLQGRRPSNLTRLVFMPTISYKRIVLPFEFVISSQSTNTVTPLDRYSAAYAIFSEIKTSRDLLNFVSNPINRIGFSPRLGSKLQLRLGTHTPYYSELTQGNISIFGGGYEYTGKRFFNAFSYGISQPAVAADSLRGLRGSYQREQWSARLGLGNLRRNFFGINLTGGKDVPSSRPELLTGVQAQQGIAASLQWRFIIAKYWTWEAEAALSAITDNILEDSLDLSQFDLPNIPDLLPINLSTRADVAGTTALRFKRKNIDLAGKVLYVGAGYKSFGFPFFQSDRLELTLNPRLSLFKNRWMISGSMGSRTNNLSGSKFAPMNQFIGNFNISGNITESFNLNLAYSNFGIRNAVLNDTFRVENISQNINITPTYIWTHKYSTDQFLLSYTLDNFEDLNVLSGEINNNRSVIYLASWNRSHQRFPFNYGLSYSQFEFEAVFASLANRSVNINAGYRFFKNRLRLSTSLGRLLNEADSDQTADAQWIGNVRLDFRNKGGYGLGLRWNSNNYVYGSQRPNSRFNEHTLRFSLSKQL